MILHVACLPFPSHQGTQAAIDAMLRASVELGETPHLLTYGYGADALETPYAHHRLADFPRTRSMRSGPSLVKLALDARCIAATRILCRRLRPKAIVAHHVEAAGAALAAGRVPVFYVAHTSLERELPVYFPGAPRKLVAAAARRVERSILARVAGAGAVAPSLVELLPARATYLPIPWPLRPPPLETREARRRLALPPDAPLCLYAGNLDAYQGWETLVDALEPLGALAPRARLLVATESNPRPLLRRAARRGVSHMIEIRPLSGEDARMTVHAAADVAWVPRRTEGGLPVKLLEASSRGVPAVAASRAVSGLSIEEGCSVVPDDDPPALAQATARLLDSPSRMALMRELAREYLRKEHSVDAFGRASREMLATRGRERNPATPTALRRQAVPARRSP